MSAPEPGRGAKQPPHPPEACPGLVAVVTAIPEEFDAIAAHVAEGVRRRIGKGRGEFSFEGKIAGAPVVLGLTGDGATRAASSVSFLLRDFPVSVLVGAGVAGALSPSFLAGEILVASRVVDEQGDAPPPDAGWVSRAVALGAKPATFVTRAKPACSSGEKKEIALRFGVDPGVAAVVDMESAAWARAAAKHGIPYAILRAVSDTFEEELPGFLAHCLSRDGSINRAAVARRLVRHPSALPKLLRVRRRVREGAGTLGLFLERLLPEKI